MLRLEKRCKNVILKLPFLPRHSLFIAFCPKSNDEGFFFLKTQFVLSSFAGAGGAKVPRAAGGGAAAPPGGDALAGGGQADRRLRAEEGHRVGHRREEGGHAEEGTGKQE